MRVDMKQVLVPVVSAVRTNPLTVTFAIPDAPATKAVPQFVVPFPKLVPDTVKVVESAWNAFVPHVTDPVT